MRSRYAERGQVLILAALFMVVLLLSAALAVDYGSWLASRRDFQSFVDASAVAGASKLPPPGLAAPNSTDQDAAAVEAMRYLNDRLTWGLDITTLSGSTIRNKTAPYVVTAGGVEYCVWIWTPTPAGSVNSGGATNTCNTPGKPLYSPANYAADSKKVFVLVASPKPGYFGGIAGIHSEVISALAVAGGAHSNYAVITLKPRLGNPDTQYGIKIAGTNTSLTVPLGDVGGNYTLQWGGSGSSVVFTPGDDQVVDLMEPARIQGVGSIINGSVHQLDTLIEDPAYGTPTTCSAGSPYTSPCWAAYPPSSGGATGNGVYPACESPAKIGKHTIDCSGGPTIQIYPGRYENVTIPNGTTATLNYDCYSGDVDCVNENRQGVFYFRLDLLNNGGGLYVKQPSSVIGCGVLLIFDPSESPQGAIQFNTGGSGSSVNINGSTCNMKSDPTNPGGTTLYRWYGYGATDFTNPVSVWVRPNRTGYNLTSTNNGSNVITMGSGSSIDENGVIYAPEDNTQVSGGPLGSGVGQIVSWTITYSGGTNITETFQGPAILRTRLYQ